ncbi:MAG TPA: ABC transporter permease [Melioribacteraceae bacterium]|nr:ABC transporter permease [Melioribacteraceae bacterium]
MSLSTFLLGKYIRSKKDSRFISTISIITALGIALGVCVVIMALTVLGGFEKVVTEKIIDLNSHIKVTSFGNRDLPASSSVLQEIEKTFDGDFVAVEPFISKLAIIKSKSHTEGVTIVGLDSTNLENTISRFIESNRTDSDTAESVPFLLGKRLAEKLFLKPGDRVTIFSLNQNQLPSSENPPMIEQLIVSGIYESGMSEYDDLNAYTAIEESSRLFGMDDKISGYNIKVNDISRIDSLSDKLQDLLGYPYYVRSIFQVHQNIFTWLELQKEPIPIILGLIIFVAVFNIIGTLLMIVLERTNTIGVLRSLGMSRKRIISLFLYHGFYLTIIGTIAGNLLAYILSILQDRFDIISLPDKIYFVSRVPIAINPDNYLFVSAITIVIALIASIIPAFVASKIKPISAIRFD